MAEVPEITAVPTATETAGVAKPNPMPGLPGGVNPLDFLYKLAMQRNMKPPEFKQVTEQGPAHMKTFVWHCSFNDMVAQGTGRSKKEAKIAAAKSIRDSIDYEKLPPAPTYNAMKRKANGNGTNPIKKKRTGFNKFPPHFPPGPGGFYGGGFFSGFPSGGGEESGGPENEDESKTEEEEAEHAAPGAAIGPPSRESFMHPSFGGFHDDSAALPFDHSNPHDRERSLMIGECQSRMARGYCSRLSKLDRHVIRKHKEIYPQETELSSILSLVIRTEDNLKKAAEKLNAETKRISGMVRIGDLSKGLLLSIDKKVDLVLLCRKWPTKGILQEILELFNSEKSPELMAEIEDEIMVVKDDAFQVNVHLTSSQGNGKEEDKEQNEAGETKIAEWRCINALRELRHSRWFAVTAANLPSCVECIRVVKDLAIRDKAWSALDNWAIEVLVERSLFSAWLPLNPAASLMRVMEIVSSGIFLNDGPGLMDPCEREAKDVAENLTKQQREDLTRSAQIFLRFMHFRQIYKVLGLESDDLFDPADTHQNGDDKAAE